MGRRRFEACASTCRGRYLGYATAPVGSYASSRTACRRSSASVGRDERYRFTNAAYSDWFGHSPNRRKGLHIREVLGDALYEKVRLRIEAALSGEEQVFEIERAFTDGTKKYLQVRSVPDVQPESDDGDVLGFYVLASDSHRRETRALSSSFEREERLRRLVETSTIHPLGGGQPTPGSSLTSAYAGGGDPGLPGRSVVRGWLLGPPYRIAEECLRNVTEHSGARNVTMTLAYE